MKMTDKPKDKNTKPEQQRQQALNAVRGALYSPSDSLQIFEENEKTVDLDFENAKLDLDIRKEKRNVRRRWNNILTWLVIVGFLLSYVLVILIGLDVLSFPDSEFAVPSVVGAGIFGTYGLAKLAIQYFFSEDTHNRS